MPGPSHSRSRKKSSKRDVIVTGNWKMYKTIEEATDFIRRLAPEVDTCQAKVFLAVPFTAIFSASELVKELKCPIVIGAQNMNDASEGAFTGEIAGKMLKEAGAEFVILGHSERRQKFKESSTLINHKVKRALKEGLQPIVCIGETLKQRQADETESVLEEQLLQSLEGITAAEMKKIILAYEPIWAIGTGKNATRKEAETTHLLLRNLIEKYWTKTVAEKMIIQYGGSVTPDNCVDLMQASDIDGLLVGGASLSYVTFGQIIKKATNGN